MRSAIQPASGVEMKLLMEKTRMNVMPVVIEKPRCTISCAIQVVRVTAISIRQNSAMPRQTVLRA